MKNIIACLLAALALAIVIVNPVVTQQVYVGGKRGELYASLSENSMANYLIVGGQNGTWGKAGQTPRLYRIFPQTHSVTRISFSAVAG